MTHPQSPQVAFFAPGWPLGECPNGIVSYVEALRTGLYELGVPSCVFVPRPSRPNESHVVGITPERPLHRRVRGAILARLGRPDSPYVDFDRALRSELERLAHRGLRVFEMEETLGLIDHVRVPGVARVARLHGPWFLNGEALGVEKNSEFAERVRLEGEAIAKADAVSSPSADVLEQVRSYYGLELPTARVIPNPGPAIPRAGVWNRESMIPTQILFVGRFDRHKGGDVVIDAFAKLAGSFPELTLVFAGPDRGLESDTGRRYDLETYVKERVPDELRPRLRLLGQTSPEEIARLRRESFLCIVASRYENFPMAAIEGLAFGCPMVGSRIGGIPEIIEHGRTGLLFRPGDSDDLVHAVTRLLLSPSEAVEFSVNARANYEARFAPSVVATAMLDFYDAIPGRHRSPARVGS